MAGSKYSDEYRKEAVALTGLPGATITRVAKDLGMNGHMLGRVEATRDKGFRRMGIFSSIPVAELHSPVDLLINSAFLNVLVMRGMDSPLRGSPFGRLRRLSHHSAVLG